MLVALMCVEHFYRGKGRKVAAVELGIVTEERGLLNFEVHFRIKLASFTGVMSSASINNSMTKRNKCSVHLGL